MIGTSISSALIDGKSSDKSHRKLAHLFGRHCRICSLTPLGHGVLPIAGSVLAFVALVFACR